MRLIAETVPQASEHIIQMLINRVTSDAEHPRPKVVFNKLGWIAQHAPSSPAAQRAFADAEAANPDLAMGEHPDLLWWAESIEVGTLGRLGTSKAHPRRISPTTSNPTQPGQQRRSLASVTA